MSAEVTACSRAAVAAVAMVLLVACASGPDAKVALRSSEFGFHNAGLVVGRTLARGEPLIGAGGLRMVFRDQTNGARFDTGSGMYGYTNSEYFAIWLAPGAYTLESIFAYNGSVAPADEPFRFVVKPGVMIYIGTVLNTWDMPPNAVERLGRPQAVKRHGRLHCPLFGSCDEKSAGGSTNRYVKGPPYAQVAVFDEGMSFLERLRAAVPDLPNVPLERWLMW